MKTGPSSLELKLSLRMLVRYPGLTLVGGLAIAFAIWVAAGTFEIIQQVINPKLPLAEGSRIVGINHFDRTDAGVQMPGFHDFVRWSGELRSVEEMGAFREVERNLISPDGIGEPVRVAEISASAFRVASVPPLLGRPLLPMDELPAADPVVLIGHEVWQRRFGGDPGVVGREVRLGQRNYTVVGVMPEGYHFPVNHDLWAPLRLNSLAFAPGESPPVRVFGRLSAGSTLEEARAELAVLGTRISAESPDTHQHLRPQVLPYARSIFNLPAGVTVGIGSINLFLVMLLVLVCGNVALLMFARAASREREMVVRSALGATRRRIIGQLFMEALVLAALGAALGLAALEYGLEWAFVGLQGAADQALPFWLRPTVSATTVGYAALLTVLAALVAGGIPGLKATRGLRAGLQRASAGGGGFRFGGIWTTIIVAQVAMTVAFPVVAYILHVELARFQAVEVGFPDEEYLAVRLEMDPFGPDGTTLDPGDEQFRVQYAAAVRRLEERLAADPGVESVTFGDALPRQYQPSRWIEVQGDDRPLPTATPSAQRATTASVAPGFFEAFENQLLAGRRFDSGDLQPGARVAVVTESFVRTVLGGRNAVGRSIRVAPSPYLASRAPAPGSDGAAAQEPWYEIVGVVRDLGIPRQEYDGTVASIYYPGAPGDIYPGHLAVRVKGPAISFAPRLRALAAAVEPSLRLYDLVPLDQANSGEVRWWSLFFWLVTAVSAFAIFLSVAGIYAVMAFTAAQRIREIGIRVALGGTPERIIRSIFRRPLMQLASGIVLGALLGAALVEVGEGTRIDLASVAMLALYTAGMTGICLLACLGPTRWALTVESTEALRAEA